MVSELCRLAIFFPRVTLYNFFLFWLIYGGSEVRVLGLGFEDVGFYVTGQKKNLKMAL